MTEAQVGFLYNIASAVSRLGNDKEHTLLRSYYLMRCMNITRGYGLPDKHFSSKIRCPNCCIEWKPNTAINLRPIKLSKRQRKRLKSRKIKESKKEYVRNRNNLIHSNEVEQICTFCKLSTVTPSPKPHKPEIKLQHISAAQIDNTKNHKKGNLKRKTTVTSLPKADMQTTEPFKKKSINVYANALDVFSLHNKKNALVTKEKYKVINNNKKKKDKFAGLCQRAVLASAKLKEEEGKQNKLSLFLKPSS